MDNSCSIDSILPLVNKPGRYADNESNACHQDWGRAEVRLCLAFPDLYEIGMSGLGVAILYSIVNRLPWALADRAYAVDVDLEARLRERGVSLWGWESRHPLKEFDLLGITLQTELGYTNVLNLLDLAQLPVRAADRQEGHPIVIGGGSCCANPEPMAPFFDCLVIGDGEEAIVEICQVLREAKQNKEGRRQKLERLAGLSGVYVPSIHASGQIIKKRTVSRLKIEDAPHPPLVPLVEVTHDRLTVEITRGCTRGCRFCQAGMIYRPVRCRPPDDILQLARDGIAASGWDEVSLLSLSTNDYPDFIGLLNRLNGCLASQRVSISVPSLRLDSFSQDVALALKKIKKSGLTFAPEAGSQRLRDAINKGLSDEDLLGVIKLARDNGWKLVKLYFMIGLPTETYQDLDALIALCRRAAGLGLAIKVALSPFVPKAQTPFQWEAQDDLTAIRDKIGYLNRGLKHPRIQLKWHDPESSILEGLLSRGDAGMSQAIESAWRLGCRFDQWNEHFDWGKWREALGQAGIDPELCSGARPVDQPLPWEHIDYGVSREFLLAERERAYRNQVTPDCRAGGCSGCGLKCPEPGPGREQKPGPAGAAQKSGPTPSDEGFGRIRKKLPQAAPLAKTRFRVKYRKGPEVKYISHLDVTRVWLRAIGRANLPVAYSQGFSPHPKLAFGPPLPLGATSRGEYMDIQLEKPASPEAIRALQDHLPRGMVISEVRPIMSNVSSITELAAAADYLVGYDGDAQALKARLDSTGSWPATVVKKGQPVEVNLKRQLISLQPSESGFVIRVRLDVSGARIGQIANILTGQDSEGGHASVERLEMYAVDGQSFIGIGHI